MKKNKGGMRKTLSVKLLVIFWRKRNLCTSGSWFKINENTLHGWLKKYKQEPEIAQTQTFRSEDHTIIERRYVFGIWRRKTPS
jgi:hypothetical protein